MSRDIRSYFMSAGGGKKEKTNTKKESKSERNESTGRSKKRQLIVLDSDSDEDPLPSNPKKQKENSILPNHEKEKKEKKTQGASKPELKPIKVADMFGDSPVVRTKANITLETKKDKPNTRPMLEDQHSDEDFEAVLMQLDEPSIFAKLKKKKLKENEKSHRGSLKRSPEKREKDHNSSSRTEAKEPKLSLVITKPTPEKHKHEVEPSETRHMHKTSGSPVVNREVEDKSKKPSSATKKDKVSHSSEKTDRKDKSNKLLNDTKEHKSKDVSRAKKCLDISGDSESKMHVKSIDRETSVCGSPKEREKSDDDVFDKKRQHAIQYHKYLHREGPKNPGGKEIPEGKPGCLSGLVFVLTGVLETIDREETTALIRKYGGKVTSNVSSNTSYLVVGDDPGPAKIEKASKLGTKQITEDGLLDLIRTRSGSTGKVEQSPKVTKKNIKENDTSEYFKKTPSRSTNLKKEETRISEIKEEPAAASASKISDNGLTSSAPTDSLLWVDKYKPTSLKQIIGQQGDRSNAKKLLKWLQNWHSNHSANKKPPRPSPWAKDDCGAFFKAALLSGSPGVGKTTTAHLVCKELGFDVVEFNASDTRSKKLLHEEVSELLSSKSLSGYFQDSAGKKPSEKHVLIMDEVDGMAGNEDRGGVQELIQLIKNSRVPIICMCNDRHHPKIRSLTNYCYDLQFSKPRLEQIRGALMSVCFKEGIKVPPDALNDIITGANQDIRQILHHLSMWSITDKGVTAVQAKQESHKAKKNIKLGPWDVLKKVFSADAHKTMTIYDKSDLFFHDYSLAPLFVQENYLNVVPHKAKGNKDKHLELIAKTAESLSNGDLVEKSIRSKNAWSLLPMQAMYSSVIPGDLMEGHLAAQINFPSWLGKNSKANKFSRLLHELQTHMLLSISGSKEAVNLDYLQHIRDALVRPLVQKGADGVPGTLAVMQNYYLLREDIDSILEVSLWPNQKDPMSSVEGKVKAALTRAYNKGAVMTPYAVVDAKKSTAKGSQDLDMDLEGELLGGEGVAEDEEEEEDITKDAMIKAKKRPAAAKDSEAGGSGAKKGRGKGGSKSESKSKRK